jgi:hypothetical protein
MYTRLPDALKSASSASQRQRHHPPHMQAREDVSCSPADMDRTKESIKAQPKTSVVSGVISSILEDLLVCADFLSECIKCVRGLP